MYLVSKVYRSGTVWWLRRVSGYLPDVWYNQGTRGDSFTSVYVFLYGLMWNSYMKAVNRCALSSIVTLQRGAGGLILDDELILAC